MSDKTIELKSGPWDLQCLPDDGARISVLRYEGLDLVTTAPANFRAPHEDYGEYELRPVYGYDDCFPSVRPCQYPGSKGVRIRDHGEVCWSKWDVTVQDNTLICSVRPEATPALGLVRKVILTDTSLTWSFEVTNDSAGDMPFMHVIHPLMPPEKIRSIKLPDFGEAVSPMRDGATLPTNTGAEQAEYLLSQPTGTADFMQLMDVKSGRVELGWDGGLTLSIDFDPKVFPTLGIWWNRGGYPDEEGIGRSECAFEPIPGTDCSLETSYASGVYQTAPAGGKVSWDVLWELSGATARQG